MSRARENNKFIYVYLMTQMKVKLWLKSRAIEISN